MVKKIREEIGKGAYGVVYSGKWRNAICVVKKMSSKEFQKEVDHLRYDLKKRLNYSKNVCYLIG